MAGNKLAGQRAAITNKKKYGEDFYKRIAAIGGSRKVKKGFAMNPELARRAGVLGGQKSRRAKKAV